jgi:hypothetical protein
MTGYKFTPSYSFITGITKAQYAVVTFLQPHDFSDGEIVSFRVTKPFGMVQLNNVQTNILSHTTSTITVNADTSSFDPFIYPVSGKVTPPVCVPVGAGLVPFAYTPTVKLDDCFDNMRT